MFAFVVVSVLILLQLWLMQDSRRLSRAVVHDLGYGGDGWLVGGQLAVLGGVAGAFVGSAISDWVDGAFVGAGGAFLGWILVIALTSSARRTPATPRHRERE